MLTAIVALTLLLPAQEAEADDPKEAARKLVNRGNQSFALEDYEGALTDYQAAYDTYPSPKILLNLAESHRALEHWVVAVQLYERYLDEVGEEDEMAGKVLERIAELDPQVGRLEIPVQAEDAVISVDGKPIEGTKAVVEPGQHQVTVTREGYHEFTRSVAVPVGEIVTVDVQMEALPGTGARKEVTLVDTEVPKEEGPITEKWWFWAGTGAAVLAVVGVVVAVSLTTGGDSFVPNGELPRMNTTDWERF